MARDPNERIGPGQDLEKADDFKALGIQIPSGFVIGTSTGQYYAHYSVHADGHTTVEWYKRGAGGGPGKPDPIEATTAGVPAKDIKDAWDKDAAKPSNVYIGTNPRTGKPSQVTEASDGSKTYDDTQVPASITAALAGSTEPPKTEDRGGRHYVWKPNPPGSGGGGQWEDVGPAPLTPAERQQQQGDAGKTGRVPKTVNGKAYDEVTTETKGPNGETITEQHYEDPANPGVKVPTPVAAPTAQGIPIGSTTTSTADGKTTKTTTYRKPDGTTEDVVDTASVAKNTETERDPSSGRTYEIVRNPDGSVKERREVKTAGSTPSYTYPELKLAYGNIANEVMAVSKDIYSRVGTGPGQITKEEADRLFKPIYEQAQLRVNEINGIVSTQKSVWDQQLSTANQRLDASTRMAGQAFGLARDAGKMAPGTGKVAGQMVWDMMNAQKDFATGMGGLADPKLPGYLQAAMEQSPNGPPPPGGPPLAVAGPAASAPGPSGADVAAQNAASQAQSSAAFGALGVPPMPMPQPAPQGGPPAMPMPQPGPSGAPPPMPMPQPMLPPPPPVTGQTPGLPQGITINIGHPGQAQQPPQPMDPQAYLQPATQQPRPSLQDHQKQFAGDLLSAGFDQDVIDQVWQQNTGRGLGG